MIWCHTISVKCWYMVNKAQSLVSRFLERCSKEEESQLWVNESRIPRPLTTVCFYTDVKDLDPTEYFADTPVTLMPPNNFGELNVETIGEDFLFGAEFAGFYYKKKGYFHIVKSVSNTKIVIHSLEIFHLKVPGVLEQVVFSQLTDKCKFLQRILNQLSREKSGLQDNEMRKRNMEKRDIVESLIGDIIALFNRSTIEKYLHPKIPGFELKFIEEKIAQGLFKIDKCIKGAGFRFSTLYIDIENVQDKMDRFFLEDEIKKYLSTKNILEYRLCNISPKETLFTHAGAMCHANGKCATLGCFAYMTRNEGCKSLCALVARHFAKASSESDNTVHLDNGRPLGTVMQCTTIQGSYDIAAVTVSNEMTTYCFNHFKNSDGILVPGCSHGEISLDDDYKPYQDMAVYIWGGTKDKQPGYGKIYIPKYISSSCDLPHMKVMDQNPKLRMASPGDSGGIICTDSLKSNSVILIAMLKGSTDDEECIAANPGRKREYVAFLLRDGLEQLEQQTNCQFELATST